MCSRLPERSGSLTVVPRSDDDRETERTELAAETKALEQEHAQLEAAPFDRPDHIAHRGRLRRHIERLKAFKDRWFPRRPPHSH